MSVFVKVVARALPLSNTWTTTLNAVSSNMLVGAQQHQMQGNDGCAKVIGANLHWDAIDSLEMSERDRCREVLPGINRRTAAEKVKIVHGDIAQERITHQRGRHRIEHPRVRLGAPPWSELLCAVASVAPPAMVMPAVLFLQRLFLRMVRSLVRGCPTVSTHRTADQRIIGNGVRGIGWPRHAAESQCQRRWG